MPTTESNKKDKSKEKNKVFLAIHGHFYQPPRENPWLEAIEQQDSAMPFHDWNERINSECYNPNSVSKIVDSKNQILFVCGRGNYETVSKAMKRDNIKVVEYVDQLAILEKVDCIICRAGATTAAEITAFGIPSILIPSPYVANNHQFYNASVLVEKKCAFMIEEKDLSLELALISSLYLVLKFGTTKEAGYPIMLFDIPLLICYYKRKIPLAVFISLILVCYEFLFLNILFRSLESHRCHGNMYPVRYQ